MSWFGGGGKSAKTPSGANALFGAGGGSADDDHESFDVGSLENDAGLLVSDLETIITPLLCSSLSNPPTSPSSKASVPAWVSQTQPLRLQLPRDFRILHRRRPDPPPPHAHPPPPAPPNALHPAQHHQWRSCNPASPSISTPSWRTCPRSRRTQWRTTSRWSLRTRIWRIRSC
ncbi:hypothetical protein DFJ73DRAFT_838826 [Zopfochytrium polystomum]|nr:hypothetical protein DFJ73DRAFT_838826 [Zopfochytrium polystomum]